MPYTPELIARIRRLHFYEHYTIHAVSKVVELHRDTIKRILYGDEDPDGAVARVRVIDPYMDKIREHLEQYPGITSTALLRILKDAGYSGSYNSLLRAVRPMKKKIKKSFKPMHVFQGEQGQVDWAHFGGLKVEGGERKLYLFAMVLSWSRTLFAKFTFDMKTDSFLRLHEEAFSYFGGNPRTILYDNLKSAVIERYRDKIVFNPQLIEFSGFYGYKPKPCRPYAGNEKGRVERAIRYIRDNFASGYTIRDVESANLDLRIWLDETANKRQWTDNKERTVEEAWLDEKKFLLEYSGRKVGPTHSSPIRSNKVSLVRFDLNDYSIPWDFTRENITVHADDFTVKFFHEGQKIAEHARCWDRGQRISNDEHWQEKPKQGLHIMDDLIKRFPVLDEFYRVLADRGEPLRSVKTQMLEMNRLHGDRIFQRALRIARKREMHHPSQITKIIIGLEKNSGMDPGPLKLTHRQDLAKFNIESHDLNSYDNL